MTGADCYPVSLFGKIQLEDFVPASNPRRPIRVWLSMNDTLAEVDERRTAA